MQAAILGCTNAVDFASILVPVLTIAHPSSYHAHPQVSKAVFGTESMLIVASQTPVIRELVQQRYREAFLVL